VQVREAEVETCRNHPRVLLQHQRGLPTPDAALTGELDLERGWNVAAPPTSAIRRKPILEWDGAGSVPALAASASPPRTPARDRSGHRIRSLQPITRWPARHSSSTTCGSR